MTETTQTTKNAYDLFFRFRDDPKFHHLVETLTGLMMHSKIAPDEMRDAAYVASIRFMQINPVRQMMYIDNTPPYPSWAWKP